MKAALLALFLIIGAGRCGAQDTAAHVKQEAQKCANAAIESDYDAVVKYTHPRVMTAMGGKDAMIASMKKFSREIKAQGISLKSAQTGEPEPPHQVGSWLISLVPQKVVLKMPKGQTVSDSYLLGISEDQGKHWVFVDLSNVNTDQLGQMFPELKGQVQVPEKKQPVSDAG